MKKRRRCVGCEERITPPESAIRVAGLGDVCPLCHEVIDLVWETEIERVREATRTLEAFIADLEAGRV